MPAIAPTPEVRRPGPTCSDQELVARMRAGDASAYEAIFRRHHEPLLSFCRHMLGGRDEAEDALQQAFIRAHRALLGPSPPHELRPWLYAIARNCCRTALAARRPETELDQEHPSLDGLSDEVARREDLRELVGDLGRLPEDQRSALLLAELEDLSHVEIAEIVGCEVSKVKALVFQARSALLAERAARDASCREIREELSVARGGQLRRGPLRRHLRLCAGCREFQQAIGQQRQAMAIVLPVAASAGLGAKILAHVAVGHTAAAAAGLAGPSIIGGAGLTTSTGLGGAVAGGTASVAGGGAVAAGTTAAASGGAVAAGGGAVAAGATTASGGALAATGTTVAVVAGGGGAGATATAAVAAAGASTAVTTGAAVGGGVLAKLAVVGAVASLATAGAVAVHHRHRAPAAHRAVPARLAAVRHDTTHRLVGGGKVTTTSAVTAKQLRRRTAVAALRRNAAGVATTTQAARRKAARLAQKRRALAKAPAAGSTAPLGTGRPLEAAGPGTPLGASKGAANGGAGRKLPANGAAGRKVPANGAAGRKVASGQTALERSAAKQAAARRAAAKRRAARAAAAKAARAAKKTAAAAAAKKAAAAARKAAAAAKKAAARAARQAARRAAAQARRVNSATSTVRKARVGAAAAPTTQTG
jgi:RNA polymerase sigma factor (sigma-70 family)